MTTSTTTTTASPNHKFAELTPNDLKHLNNGTSFWQTSFFAAASSSENEVQARVHFDFFYRKRSTTEQGNRFFLPSLSSNIGNTDFDTELKL